MDTSLITELNRGFTTAFIDSSSNSSLAFKPDFLSNDYRTGKKVLSSIEDELIKCDKFQINHLLFIIFIALKHPGVR